MHTRARFRTALENTVPIKPGLMRYISDVMPRTAARHCPNHAPPNASLGQTNCPLCVNLLPFFLASLILFFLLLCVVWWLVLHIKVISNLLVFYCFYAGSVLWHRLMQHLFEAATHAFELHTWTLNAYRSAGPLPAVWSDPLWSDPNRKSITAFINHAGHVEVKKELWVYTNTKRFNDKTCSRKWEQIGWVGIFQNGD